MEFGSLIFTKPQRAISDTRRLEARGFSHAWFPDSHMIWGDAYACMALGAVNTSKIKLGTGVSVASNRIPPVTAHAIATINEIAPGRVILGYGTGHTGRRVMGLPPVKFADFRREVRTLRDLLKTGEAEYQAEGQSRRIRYLHRDLRFINLDDPIPLYVAANGPRALGLAGEFGDGVITTGVVNPERLAAVQRHVAAGAAAAGRKLANLPYVSLTQICVLQPGEAVDSPRVARMVGPWVITSLHAIAAGYAKPRSLSAGARAVYDAYTDYVDHLPGAPAEHYLELHRGHCTFVPERERRFVTAETISTTTLVGSREEVLTQLHQLEQAGLTQIVLNPPFDGYEEFIDDFSREVLEHW